MKVLASVLFAVLAASAVGTALAGPAKVLQNLKGSVSYRSPHGLRRAVALRASVLVRDRDVASTGAASLGVLTLPDSSRIMLGQRTRVRVGLFQPGAVAKARFVVYNGQMRFTVEHPHGARANYVFQTPVASIAVRGTIGDISVDVVDGMRLNVYHLSSPNLPVIVQTVYGQRFVLRGGQKVWVRWLNGRLVGRETALSKAEIDRFAQFGAPRKIDTPLAVPVPSPMPSPTRVSFSGFLRAYQFQRINAVGINQQAVNFGGGLHAEYTARSRPFTVATTYFFADPLGLNGNDPQANPAVDNTLPGYNESSQGELYAQYRTWRDFLQAGKMQIFTPWANPADGRMIPVTFQGILARSYIAPGWDVGVARIARFKSRTSSTFDANDLLTNDRTPGFLLVDLTHATRSLRASLHQYWFYDVAALTYAQMQIDLPHHRFIAAQAVAESNAGRSLLGTIHNHTLGLELGARIGAVHATLGWDRSPSVLYETASPGSIFTPIGGTPASRSLGGGLFEVVGGGIASPYTDGYVSDPLFTTSIVTSLVDRRSPGSAVKIAFAATTADGRWSGQIAQTYFDFNNALGSASATESDADVTVLLSRIDPVLPFTGLSLRQRWGYRVSSGPPLRFLYSRTQLQYTF